MLRAAAAYVVASWVLLQVAEMLAPILDLPEWSAKLVFFILLIGFIPTLILSWAYDLTTDDGDAPPGKYSAAADRRNGPIALAIGLVIAGLAVGGWWYSGKDARWAANEAMPAIEAFLENGDPESAFSLDDVNPFDSAGCHSISPRVQRSECQVARTRYHAPA